MSDDSALKNALKATNSVDVDRIVAEMKGSALARSNWETLIASAPIALRCMGACFMAASSKDIQRVEVPLVKGYTIERPLDLTTNLIQCSALGRDAFLVANKGMVVIYETSGMSENKVYDIVDTLGNPKSAAKLLPTLLQQLQDNADSCYQTCQGIDDAFYKWLVYTTELHAACQNQTGVVADAATKALTDKAVAIVRAKDLDAQIKTTKKSMEELGKTMDSARVAYEKASNAQPTGWDIVGQQIVGALGECITTAVSQAIPAVVDNLNPISKIKAAGSMIGDLANGKKDTNGSSKIQQPGKVPVSATPVATPTPASAPTEPAFAYIKRDSYLYDLLKPIVRKTDGDVDWDLVGAGADGNNGLAFVLAMLSDSKQSLSKQSGGGVATSTYQGVLDDAIKISTEIQKAKTDAAKNLNAELPKKGSESIVRWQTTFDNLYKNQISLGIQAQSLPYNSSSPAGTITDPALQAAKINAQTTQSQAVLTHAAARLETTAKTLESTTKIYGETAKLLSDQQDTLATINANLAKLTADVISLAQAKEILIQCIGLIVELKAKITDLTNFFGTLSAVIQTVANTLVKQWIQTVKAAVGDSNSLNKGVLKIGAYTLETCERTMIMQGSISMAAYFSFFADVAKAWNDVSQASIFPGITLAESLSIPGDAKAKMAKLDQWSKEAQANINKVCGEQRKAIQQGMQERVEGVRGLIKTLPASTVPPAITQVADQVVKQLEAKDIATMKEEENTSTIKSASRRQIVTSQKT